MEAGQKIRVQPRIIAKIPKPQMSQMHAQKFKSKQCIYESFLAVNAFWVRVSTISIGVASFLPSFGKSGIRLDGRRLDHRAVFGRTQAQRDDVRFSGAKIEPAFRQKEIVLR